MISSKFFIDKLVSNGLDFFAGVPDSLLKNVCAYITDNIDSNRNLIAANEGGAIGLAAGHYLATGKAGVVYMQNSGEGNIINPLLSLVDKEVYAIPVLLVIGWRGRPGVHDEPQHVKQGKVTLTLLETMGVSYEVLSREESEVAIQIEKAIAAVNAGEIYALVIEKDTFDTYKLQKNEVLKKLTMTREEAIIEVASSIEKNAVIVSTTGMISRELFEHRTRQNEVHERDFLTVGSMGHASQIALGIALEKQNRPVYCFDGDGASIMHMGNMAIVAQQNPMNYVHVIFNNGAHDSVGGQPTVGLKIDLPAVAKAVGYRNVFHVETLDELKAALTKIKTINGTTFLEVCVKKGNRKDLGRPTITPVQNKEALMEFLKK
ncbi:phosphonopyruvate decarboxylase [Bacteroides bouchesdurhonensis]